MASSSAGSEDSLAYLIHHIVLPPKLPQRDDRDPSFDRHLLDTVTLALQDLKAHVDAGHSKTVESAIATIQTLRDSRDASGHISKAKIQNLLTKITRNDFDGFIPLEIKRQNAAILLSRCANGIKMEVFELSPVNHHAMKTQGRLKRNFPASMMEIAVVSMRDNDRMTSLARTLAKLDDQKESNMQSKRWKNNYRHDEDRDTSSPDMVTDFFMHLNAPIGKIVNFEQLVKYTREEVLWKDCNIPWRRSPLWLLTRVTLQLLFMRSETGSQPPDRLYKVFMIYLLSRLLGMAKPVWRSLGGESMEFISAKLEKRLRKLDHWGQIECLDPAWATPISNNIIDAHNLLEQHFKGVAFSTKPLFDHTSLHNLEPKHDLDLSLCELDEFLSTITSRTSTTTLRDFKPPLTAPEFSNQTLPEMKPINGMVKQSRLAALELWVEQHLDSWMALHRMDESTCGQLRSVMEAYHTTAREVYDGVQINTAIMYLTLLELWVACDQSICSIIPLSKDYKPEVPTEEFQCLLLPLKSQLSRLAKIECYIEARQNAAKSSAPSLFREFGHPDSFAVKYFDSDKLLQVVHARIEQDAAKKMRQKGKELIQLQQKYAALMGKYNDPKTKCDFFEMENNDSDSEEKITVHDGDCRKCALLAQANALSIHIYEWPLSPEKAKAKATVFELKIPQAFSDWRDATMYLSCNVLGFKDATRRPLPHRGTLQSHHGLKDELSKTYSRRRMILLSTVKSHTTTHRDEKNGIQNLRQADICLQNALRYEYFDEVQDVSNAKGESTAEIPWKCLYGMPKRSKTLRKFMSKPPSAPDGVAPNEVMANLEECPRHFSIDEFKAFCTLALGHKVIYSSILTQLAMPSIDFAKPEVQSLILQVAHQVGPCKDGRLERATHGVLVQESFGHNMLDQLEAAMHRVADNWESWRAVASFVRLAQRVLHLTSSPSVRTRGIEFLVRAQAVTMKWLVRLQGRVAISTDNKQKNEFRSRATEIALVCASTFEIDYQFVEDLLQQPSAVSSLLQCSMTIQENVKGVRTDDVGLFKNLFGAWKSMMYRLLQQLREHVIRDCKGLNTALLANWADFRPDEAARWIAIDKSWISIKSDQLPVHFNLVTAELFVNGLPLARLPNSYVQHDMYRPLFQASTLDVAPTNEPGMAFSAKSKYHGHIVHFGFSNNNDMLVLAIAPEMQLDLLPSRLFQNRLPLSFQKDFIHWYDHGSGDILFRPRANPWNNSKDEWRMKRSGSQWRLVKDEKTLVNPRKHSAQELSRIFTRLENSQNIHIVFGHADLSTRIILPRLKLEFVLRHRETNIYSHQYRGMIIDRDQTMGTLVGLSSTLVLKCANQVHDRLILIPVPASYKSHPIIYSKDPDTHHVSVSISKDTAYKVYAYSLDAALRRIIDTEDLHSKLLLAYLHALTSFCVPDPFTGYTGIESALNILRSGAVRSFGHLSKENFLLLEQIAMLSPLRCFYPPKMMEMQQISWNSQLPVLSQHPDLRSNAEDIVHQANKMQLFDPTIKLSTSQWKSSDSHLDLRDAIRASTYRTDGFGAEIFTKDKDDIYCSRDRINDSKRSRQVSKVASLVLRDGSALSMPIPDLKASILERHFKNRTVAGPQQSFDKSILQYDSTWMANPSELLQQHWCNLHKTLSQSDAFLNKHDITTWLCTMAYAPATDMEIIEALAAFYSVSELSTIQPPSVQDFPLHQGTSVQSAELRYRIAPAAKSFANSAEAQIPRNSNETKFGHSMRIQSLWQSRSANAVNLCVMALEAQWPCMQPKAPDSPQISEFVKVSTAMPEVNAYFKRWYENRRFEEYLKKVGDILAQQSVVAPPILSLVTPGEMKKPVKDQLPRFFSTRDIFKVIPLLPQSSFSIPQEPILPIRQQNENADRTGFENRLEHLCVKLQKLAKSKCENDYVESLQASCASLVLHKTGTHESGAQLDGDFSHLFRDYLIACKQYFANLNDELASILVNNGSFSDRLALAAHKSPRICPSFWLVQLRRERFETLSDTWKTIILRYVLAITQLHRAQRLAGVSHKPVELLEELRHIGHSNWDPAKSPETLLLEAESKFLLRYEQEYIASYMRNPQNGENIALQLLMGAGKSSTIVPVVAAFLADGKTLVRVLVAKPQSNQMLQILIAKLCGLLGRQIYQMPFTRNVRMDLTNANELRSLYQECIDNRGILLVQPEHLLSFKLMGIESLLTGRGEVAKSLLDTQQYFDNTTRDIVDESDLNFSPRFELVYTMGSQQTVEYAPERWLILQDVMRVVARVALQVKETFPTGIELENQGGGRFPRIRLLDNDATEELLTETADRIVSSGVRSLPTGSQTLKVKCALLRYITELDLTDRDIDAVEKSKFWTDSTRFPLLIIRGLIAGGILRFALSTKRWRVNFGSDPLRVPKTSLAVPYRSKDSPALRSEFSHPEVVIILSLLSYYYGGLSDDELFDAFEHLSKSDQADRNYNDWVMTASPDLAPTFKHLSGVSIRDRLQCTEDLFPALRFSKNAIDYYFSTLIFPKEMKQFPEKLSSSGWDIGAVKTFPTCGFSGTNDTHHLLPLSVKHMDLPSQSHTNAQVLEYLLRDDTCVHLLPRRQSGSDAENLIKFINTLEKGVKVILDCGASILEQNNKQVGQTWLDRSPSGVQAVVYFEGEALSILDRTGRVEAFQTSPFAKQLDVCVVYLDEAHTRGTDLKLPRDYRAAVTLGAQLTKDSLTQACMRMRQLGKGQAITFIVPEEISTKIRDLMSKASHEAIDVSDVICWSVQETWTDLKKSMPLWAVQGHRYESHKHLLRGADTTPTQAQQFLEDEVQTLEARYRPSKKNEASIAMTRDWDTNDPNIHKIISRCRDFEVLGSSAAATLSEEQERELAPEIEQERQVQRPPRMAAAEHAINMDLLRLAKTGQITRASSAWGPAFMTLRTTSAAQLYDLNNFPTTLLATADYVRTVKAPSGTVRAGYVSDSYLSPVRWVLSVTNQSGVVENLIILSHYEANHLVEEIEMHSKVTLHHFASQLNSSFKSLDELTLNTFGRKFDPKSVPRSLTVQLNLFSGSLYLRSFAEYQEVCDFLGLLHGTPEEDQRVAADGFIEPPAGKWGLKTSPVPFLRALLMKIRREGDGIEKTHMGKILSGIRLEEDVDFKAEN